MTGLILIFSLLRVDCQKADWNRWYGLEYTVSRHLNLGCRLIETVRDSFVCMLMPLYGENQPQKNWSAAGVV